MIFKATTRHDPESGTLVLTIDPADLSPHIDPMLIDATRFNPKSELHVTIIGRSTAEALTGAGAGPEAVAELLARLPKSWRVRRLGRWWRIDDPDWTSASDDNGTGRSSILEEVQCPEGEALYGALARQTGQPLPEPAFHITFYIRRDPDGIAVPDQDRLKALGKPIESLT